MHRKYSYVPHGSIGYLKLLMARTCLTIKAGAQGLSILAWPCSGAPGVTAGLETGDTEHAQHH